MTRISTYGGMELSGSCEYMKRNRGANEPFIPPVANHHVEYQLLKNESIISWSLEESEQAKGQCWAKFILRLSYGLSIDRVGSIAVTCLLDV